MSFPRFVKALHVCLCEVLELLPDDYLIYIPRLHEQALAVRFSLLSVLTVVVACHACSM